MTKLRFASLVWLLAAACSSSHAMVTPDLASVHAANEVDVAATAGTLGLPFSMTATGAGTTRLGAVNLTNSVGTVDIDGSPLPAFVFEQQAWPDQGYTLYQTLIVGSDRWYVAWLYCTEVGVLTSLYFEGTDGTLMDYEDATGTCTSTATKSNASIAVPATKMDVTLTGDFTVAGDAVAVNGATPGRLTITGTDHVLLPFDVVDCTNCGADGWYELHSIAWEPLSQHATFVILYFWPARPTEILAAYALTLPTLTTPFDTLKLSGTWTYSPPSMRRIGAPASTARVPWHWAPPLQ